MSVSSFSNTNRKQLENRVGENIPFIVVTTDKIFRNN